MKLPAIVFICATALFIAAAVLKNGWLAFSGIIFTILAMDLAGL